MTPYWFSKTLPSSRHGIENAVRLAFWAAGFGDTYFTCTSADPPYKCMGLWRSTDPLEIEWVPMDHFLLRMKKADQDAFDAFERVLGHAPLAAYRDASGDVLVEWRVQGGSERLAELEKAGVKDLERF